MPWIVVDKGSGNTSQGSPRCRDKPFVSPLDATPEGMAVVHQAIPSDCKPPGVFAIGLTYGLSQPKALYRLPTSQHESDIA